LQSNDFPGSSLKTVLKFSTTGRFIRNKARPALIKNWSIYLVCLLAWLPIDMNAQNLPKNSPVRFLALGDSYTIGESVAEPQRWPEQLTTALNKKRYRVNKPEIVAVTGWRTDQLKHELLAMNLSHDYDLVSLLIGVNNQYQGRNISEYELEFGELLELAIEHASGDASKVFVLSIPDYGFTPFGKAKQAEISAGIDAFNAVNRSITLKHKVTYIDITQISRRALAHRDLLAPDGLHPSGKMYELWVEKILREL
jgi:lysophospholipase L1-like esterase